MNGTDLHVHGRRPFSSVLVPVFMLCLTAFGERALLAFNPSPAPRVFFDQTVTPAGATCPLAQAKLPDVPPQALIGEPFKFRVRFKNDNTAVFGSPNRTGYGPFIDLVLDAGGANILKPSPCGCDGITVPSPLQANMIDVSGGAVSLKVHQSLAPCAPTPSQFALPHPFADVQPVLVPAGSQLVTIELPFGSFDPTQPEIVVEVTAFVSKNADVGHPLNIYARGGFRYGRTPGVPPDFPVLSDVIVPGNPPSNAPSNQETDPTHWAAQEPTTPTVLIVRKKYLGLEDENATGPNITSNTPRQYEITLDIAIGQTVTNLTLADTIPLNMVFDLPASLPPGFTTPHLPPSIGPGGIWTVNGPTITGGLHPDATIVVGFYVPERDANHALVLPANCDDVHSVNTVQASGAWQPVDTCDTGPVHLTSTAQHDLFDKCLAIQKSVAVAVDKGAAGPTPGDTLTYTLNFQVSDFRNMGHITIHDVLSDGQTLVPVVPSSAVPAVMLSVTDQCGTTPPTLVPAAAIAVLDQCPPGGPFSQLPSRTTLDINVSLAMISPGHPSGILTGGHTTTLGSPTPATGVITFQTTIDDNYLCTVASTSASPHDQFVDKDDPLSNDVTITGTVYDDKPLCTDTPSATTFTATDVSKTCIPIVTDFLAKKVYAVTRNGIVIWGPNTPLLPLPDVIPGDQVTFRLTKTIPSSDAENLTIQDWLPLPIFDVNDPQANGSGQAWSTSFNLTICAIPAPGSACLVGPTDTLSLYPGLAPTFPTLRADPTNSIIFDYGTFNDSNNTPRTIDLLFTITATNAPFADGLYLTNEAQERETNTFGVTFSQTAIAQVHVREPALKITKGVVAANNPNAVFSPPLVGPVTFDPPGSPACPRFNGTVTPINSTNLTATPINSDVSNVDAYDCVTFAIVVENTGGSPAYGVQLRDLFPASPALDCFGPDFGSFCVTDGTGALLPHNFSVGSNTNEAIAFSNPLPGLTSSTAAGTNIIVITFDACVFSNITPHCCDNSVFVEHYTSTPAFDPNFVGAGFGGPFHDTAQVCVRPKPTKSITTTSEGSTPGPPLPSLPEQLAIGEIIRYHLEVVVPETTSPSTYQLRDFLPPGLSYLPGPTSPQVTLVGTPLLTATLTPTVTFSTPQITCNPGTVDFAFGNVTNSNNDTAQELIQLEFNALVSNISCNQNGVHLDNSFSVIVNGQPVATSNTVSAVVVEPNIAIAKAVTVAPSLASGATATYTVTLTNNGTATAFDVLLTDQLPDCLTKLTVTGITTTGVVTGLSGTSTPTMLHLSIGSMAVNATVTVTYTATVTCVDCSKLINTAKVTWTSLPGPFGTTANPTGSSTPGASGHADGERDDSGGVNDYVATAAATLCCALVTDEHIHCNPSGSFAYTFTVKNFSSCTVSGINVVSPASSPPNVTITPGPITGLPMISGGSAMVSVIIGGTGAVSGANVCFSVVLTGAGAVCCRTEQCITLPKCCVQPPSDMEAWYPLDEGAGATAVADISGNNHVGTPQLGPVGTNGPLSNFPNPPYVVGGSLYFFAGPSSLAYVTVPDTPPLSLDIELHGFTIDAWIYENGGPAPIVDKFEAATKTGYRLYLGAPVTATDATLYFSYGDGSISLTVPSIFPIPFHKWHHVAVTVSRSATIPFLQVLFYVDGTPAGGQSVIVPVGSIANTLPLFIGGFQPSPPVTGATEIGIDELELFHRALSQTEIQGIFDAGSAGKCQFGQRIGVVPVPARRPPVRHIPFH